MSGRSALSLKMRGIVLMLTRYFRLKSRSDIPSLCSFIKFNRCYRFRKVCCAIPNPIDHILSEPDKNSFSNSDWIFGETDCILITTEIVFID